MSPSAVTGLSLTAAAMAPVGLVFGVPQDRRSAVVLALLIAAAGYLLLGYGVHHQPSQFGLFSAPGPVPAVRIAVASTAVSVLQVATLTGLLLWAMGLPRRHVAIALGAAVGIVLIPCLGHWTTTAESPGWLTRLGFVDPTGFLLLFAAAGLVAVVFGRLTAGSAETTLPGAGAIVLLAVGLAGLGSLASSSTTTDSIVAAVTAAVAAAGVLLLQPRHRRLWTHSLAQAAAVGTVIATTIATPVTAGVVAAVAAAAASGLSRSRPVATAVIAGLAAGLTLLFGGGSPAVQTLGVAVAALWSAGLCLVVAMLATGRNDVPAGGSLATDRDSYPGSQTIERPRLSIVADEPIETDETTLRQNDRHDEMEHTITELRETVSQVTAHRDSLQAALLDRDDEIAGAESSYKSTVAALEDRLAATERAGETATEALSAAKQQIAELTEQLSGVRQDSELSTAEHVDVVERLQQLQADSEEWETERETLQSQTVCLEQSVREQTDRLQSLQDDYTASTSALADAEQRLATAEAAVANLTDERDAIVQAASEEAAEQNRQIETLSADLAATSTRLQQTEAELDATRADDRGMATQTICDQQQAQIHRLMRDLSAAREAAQEPSEQAEQIASLREDLNRQAAIAADLRSQLDLATTSAAESQPESGDAFEISPHQAAAIDSDALLEVCMNDVELTLALLDQLGDDLPAGAARYEQAIRGEQPTEAMAALASVRAFTDQLPLQPLSEAVATSESAGTDFRAAAAVLPTLKQRVEETLREADRLVRRLQRS